MLDVINIIHHKLEIHLKMFKTMLESFKLQYIFFLINFRFFYCFYEQLFNIAYYKTLQNLIDKKILPKLFEKL